MSDDDDELEKEERRRWGKIYALGIPVVGLVAWLWWDIHPVMVLMGIGLFWLITFFWVIGWIRPTGGGGDAG